MQPSQAAQMQPPSAQQRDYSKPLVLGFLALLPLWVVMFLIVLQTTNLISQIVSQHSSLSLCIVLALLGWPLLPLASLGLLIGMLLLASPQTIRQIARLGAEPPQRQAHRFLWIGALLITIYLLFCLGTLFSVPASVISLIVMVASPFCSMVGPALTLRYMQRQHRP